LTAKALGRLFVHLSTDVIVLKSPAEHMAALLLAQVSSYQSWIPFVVDAAPLSGIRPCIKKPYCVVVHVSRLLKRTAHPMLRPSSIIPLSSCTSRDSSTHIFFSSQGPTKGPMAAGLTWAASPGIGALPSSSHPLPGFAPEPTLEEAYELATPLLRRQRESG